ncbi:hypothetical protein CK203_084073 [Vitis vinifera]|uniref:Reverse transcriptase RNase H-like domain-containing protein n=1 Tax=Vitis vinifera TaxID=29760 RepID=A0A438FJT8_VITVI|nr:hypothetical protein CK203_084073 [Vitis vinifera]
MTFCFPDEIDDHGAFAEDNDIVDGAVPHDEYIDEMLAMSLSRIEERVHPGLTSPFDLFGVFFIEIAEEIQTAPAPEIVEDAIAVVDLIDDPVSLILDIDDEIAQHDLDDDSSSVSDSDPVDQRVSPAVGDTEIVISAPQISLGVEDREEIQKQLSVGFLLVVEYPKWLANVVLVPKKDGKILMASEDMEKTSFITKWGTYCYRVMPFGLKNAGATYQRAATTLFHDMMHRGCRVQVETESQEVHFRSGFWETLGYMVSERGIEVDPDKIRAIMTYLPDDREECQRAFERIREYLLSPPVLAPSYTGPPSTPILINEDVAVVTSLSDLFVWHSRIDIRPTNNIVEFRASGKTRDAKLRPYHAYLELLVMRFDDLRYTHLPKVQNQFVDALATLASYD